MSQFILIAVDLTVIFLDLLCLFLKLFQIHLRGILLDVLSTELLLEFVYRVTEFISLFTVFTGSIAGSFPVLSYEVRRFFPAPRSHGGGRGDCCCYGTHHRSWNRPGLRIHLRS